MGDILSGNNSKDEDMFFFLNPPCIKGNYKESVLHIYESIFSRLFMFIFRVFP